MILRNGGTRNGETEGPGMQVAKRLGEERFFSGAFVVFRMLTDLSTSVEMIK